MRAYEISIVGDPEGELTRTVYAQTGAAACYATLRALRDAGWEVGFKDLRRRSLGKQDPPPTAAELAQREADSFNVRFPVGTPVLYWSGVKEGPPTGRGAINHEATVVCQHAVAWIEGARSCHSITHVEEDRCC